MENLQPGEGSSSVAGESSDSTFQLNIKTLDSRIFSFQVDKNILVLTFKEKIASEVGVPVGLQLLIFKGKVLRDGHLSEYNVEHGDTLTCVNCVAPTNTREPTSVNITGGGHDSYAAGPHNLIGEIRHGVVAVMLGSDVPDLSRVMGVVLDAIGIGNPEGGMQPGVQVNAGGQVQGGHSFCSFHVKHGPSAPNPMQNPVGTATTFPLLNRPIPNSLNTLTEFMHRMQSELSQVGTRPIQSPTSSSSPPTPELPVNSHGFPTVEALTTVLGHAQRLLSHHVVPALFQTTIRLDLKVGYSDPATREQARRESVQLGVAMQHLGALILELGRTILTLRIGQSYDESFLNTGPAVYISPSGPNPIVVQLIPPQSTDPHLGDSGVPPIHAASRPIGRFTRNPAIHIHTGPSLVASSSRVVDMPSTSRNADVNTSSSFDVLMGGVSQETVLCPLNVLRHTLLQLTLSQAMRNVLHQMEYRDLDGNLDPLPQQIFQGNSMERDEDGNPKVTYVVLPFHIRQVNLRNVVMRIGILSPEEILFNLVNAAVRPSNSGDSEDESLVSAICSQNEVAQEFLEKLLSDISERIKYERERERN